MIRPYYTEYVNHMLRYYTRHTPKEVIKMKFKSETDRKNWLAVNRVLHQLPERDRDIIFTVFGRGDTVADNIYELSKEMCIRQDTIWNLVSRVSYKIAKERKLI